MKDNSLKTLPYYLDFEADYSFKTLKNVSGVLLSLTEAKIRAKMLITNKSHAEVFKKRMISVHKLARNGKKVIKRMA